MDFALLADPIVTALALSLAFSRLLNSHSMASDRTKGTGYRFRGNLLGSDTLLGNHHAQERHRRIDAIGVVDHCLLSLRF
jgi:hypothetical protein